jgi:hypothetical protein
MIETWVFTRNFHRPLNPAVGLDTRPGFFHSRKEDPSVPIANRASSPIMGAFSNDPGQGL